MRKSYLSSRAPALWLLALLICGCASVPRASRAPIPVEAVTMNHASGLKVTAHRAPTPGLVYLSLWIDAGSRDADPPQLATVAALLAAAEAGNEVVARVLPDGTELGRRCAADEIEACLEQLARGLSLRSAPAADVAAAIAEIQGRRRRAAANEAREADRLALRALLGDSARGFFPLGEATEDAEVEPRSVERFLSDHYGPERSHLIAVGAVEEEVIAGSASRRLGGLPRAAARRRPATALTVVSGLALELGASAHASVAMTLADGETAREIAQRLIEPTAPALPGVEHWVRAFEVRGGGLLVAGARGASPAALVRGMSWAVSRLDLPTEDAGPTTALRRARSPRALDTARGIGRRWAAPPVESEPPQRGLGVGAVVPGGRGDRLTSDDPDAAARARAQEELEAALAEGRALAAPEALSLPLENGASLQLQNGARISVLSRAADTRFAVALKIEGGASEDDARLHGATALLAELVAAECRTLLASVEGVEVGFFVEDERWGLIASAPLESERESVEGLLRCGLHPDIREDEVEDARLELLSSTSAVGSDLWLANLGAAVIAPARPGLVAPLGSHDGLLRVRRIDLLHARDRMLVGRRVTVAAVGRVDAEALARRAASLLSPLPRGDVVEVAEGPPLAADVVAARWDREPIWVLVAWRSESPDPRGIASRAFATEAGRRLRAIGLSPVWSDGEGGRWGSWAAVTLAVPEGTLTALPAHIASLRVTREAHEAALRREDEAARWRSADPGHAALELMREAHDEESTARVLGGLSAATPAYVIIRDSSSPSFEDPDAPRGQAAR